jgi:hypothetical protein
MATAAAACRERLAAGGTFEEAAAPLLALIRSSDERFAFDSEGRPGAIDAVRQALPAVERDLFDAVVDDHACEVAALREALRQLASSKD